MTSLHLILMTLITLHAAPAKRSAVTCAADLSKESMAHELRALREALKPLAAEDTAYDVEEYRASLAKYGYPLAGHCGAVARVVWSKYGGKVFLGRYVDAEGRSTWHVFNRLLVGNIYRDYDLTKGQFGLHEDSEELRPPPLFDISLVPEQELKSNPRLQQFVKRYRASLR